MPFDREASQLEQLFSHRWAVHRDGAGEYMPCQEGRLRGRSGDWVEFSCQQGDLAERVAALPFVEVLRNDTAGLVVKFRYFRIHSLCRAGVEPLSVRGPRG